MVGAVCFATAEGCGRIASYSSTCSQVGEQSSCLGADFAVSAVDGHQLLIVGHRRPVHGQALWLRCWRVRALQRMPPAGLAEAPTAPLALQKAGGLRPKSHLAFRTLSANTALLHSTLSAENMRREGFELSVSPPRVVLREEEGAWRCHAAHPLAHWLLQLPAAACLLAAAISPFAAAFWLLSLVTSLIAAVPDCCRLNGLPPASGHAPPSVGSRCCRHAMLS